MGSLCCKHRRGQPSGKGKSIRTSPLPESKTAPTASQLSSLKDATLPRVPSTTTASHPVSHQSHPTASNPTTPRPPTPLTNATRGPASKTETLYENQGEVDKVRLQTQISPDDTFDDSYLERLSFTGPPGPGPRTPTVIEVPPDQRPPPTPSPSTITKTTKTTMALLSHLPTTRDDTQKSGSASTTPSYLSPPSNLPSASTTSSPRIDIVAAHTFRKQSLPTPHHSTSKTTTLLHSY